MLRNVNHAANFIFLALEHIFRCPFYCVCAVCGLPYKWFDLQMFVALLNNNAQLFISKNQQQIPRCRNISKIQ
jgi:hypothetical protein